MEDLEKEICQRRAGGSAAGGNVPPSHGGPGRRALPWQTLLRESGGRGLILAGLLLLAAALALVLYNLWDAWRAERSVAQALEALRQETALS